MLTSAAVPSSGPLALSSLLSPAPSLGTDRDPDPDPGDAPTPLPATDARPESVGRAPSLPAPTPYERQGSVASVSTIGAETDPETPAGSFASASGAAAAAPGTGRRKPRKQRYTRGRQGCFTCRARRKKCDGENEDQRDPVTGGCMRCRRAGFECLGFPSDTKTTVPTTRGGKGGKTASRARKPSTSGSVDDAVPASGAQRGRGRPRGRPPGTGRRQVEARAAAALAAQMAGEASQTDGTAGAASDGSTNDPPPRKRPRQTRGKKIELPALPPPARPSMGPGYSDGPSLGVVPASLPPLGNTASIHTSPRGRPWEYDTGAMTQLPPSIPLQPPPHIGSLSPTAHHLHPPILPTQQPAGPNGHANLARFHFPVPGLPNIPAVSGPGALPHGLSIPGLDDTGMNGHRGSVSRPPLPVPQAVPPLQPQQVPPPPPPPPAPDPQVLAGVHPATTLPQPPPAPQNVHAALAPGAGLAPVLGTEALTDEDIFFSLFGAPSTPGPPVHGSVQASDLILSPHLAQSLRVPSSLNGPTGAGQIPGPASRTSPARHLRPAATSPSGVQDPVTNPKLAVTRVDVPSNPPIDRAGAQPVPRASESDAEGYGSQSDNAAPTAEEEDQLVDALNAVYGVFLWGWWGSSANSGGGLRATLRAVKRILHRSSLVRSSAAAVTAGYVFDDILDIPAWSNPTFKAKWRQIFDSIRRETAVHKASRSNGHRDGGNWRYLPRALRQHVREGHRPSSTSPTLDQPGNTQAEGRKGGLQRSGQAKDTPEPQELIDSVAETLANINRLAREDDLSRPPEPTLLRKGAVVVIDDFLHSAMNLALFDYARKTPADYIEKMDASSSLLASLVGPSCRVRIESVNGPNVCGFRTFAWCDILLAVTTGRPTALHYLLPGQKDPTTDDTSDDDDGDDEEGVSSDESDEGDGDGYSSDSESDAGNENEGANDSDGNDSNDGGTGENDEFRGRPTSRHSPPSQAQLDGALTPLPLDLDQGTLARENAARLADELSYVQRSSRGRTPGTPRFTGSPSRPGLAAFASTGPSEDETGYNIGSPPSSLLRRVRDRSASLRRGAARSRSRPSRLSRRGAERSDTPVRPAKRKREASRGSAAASPAASTNSARANGESQLRVSFGCPDDILAILAAIANLNFMLSQARLAATGTALSAGAAAHVRSQQANSTYSNARSNDAGSRMGSGTISPTLPSMPGSTPALANGAHSGLTAWAMQLTNEYQQALTASFDRATVARGGLPPLGTAAMEEMWRHGAQILLNTTLLGLGPLAPANRTACAAILKLWDHGRSVPAVTTACGNPALPLLLAAFVAVTEEDRRVCWEALHRIGQRERCRQGYRDFVYRLWSKQDRQGFAMLWTDFQLLYDTPQIVLM